MTEKGLSMPEKIMVRNHFASMSENEYPFIRVKHEKENRIKRVELFILLLWIIRKNATWFGFLFLKLSHNVKIVIVTYINIITIVGFKIITYLCIK